MSDKFTIKQEKAIQHYLLNGNKTAAYRHAYSCDKMKPETVNRKAKYLFDLDKIRARVDYERKEAWRRNHMTLDELLSRLANLSRADIGLLFNEHGGLRPLSEIPEEVRMSISGIETFEVNVDGEVVGETKKIRKIDPTKPMDMLMKHLGGYEKDNQQQQNNVTIFQIPDNGR